MERKGEVLWTLVSCSSFLKRIKLSERENNTLLRDFHPDLSDAFSHFLF